MLLSGPARGKEDLWTSLTQGWLLQAKPYLFLLCLFWGCESCLWCSGVTPHLYAWGSLSPMLYQGSNLQLPHAKHVLQPFKTSVWLLNTLVCAPLQNRLGSIYNRSPGKEKVGFPTHWLIVRNNIRSFLQRHETQSLLIHTSENYSRGHSE